MAVATVHLEPRDLERTYATSGTLRAIRSADIVATQPAVIVSLPVQEGDRVKAGDVLAQLDSRNTGLQAAQNRVQLENLQRELDRLETAAPGVFSAEEIDKQRYAVAEARAALKLSKHQVGQTVVRAPFAGTIVARKAEVGTYASSSTVLVSLADLDVLELDLHIPERDAATVKSDATVDVELVDGTHFAADLVRRSPVVDPLTGTTKFTVRAEKFPEAAAPGAFVRATLLVDSRLAAPSVPRSAVFEVEGKPHVFVVVDGKARRRPVVLGLEGGEAIEIVEGLEPTDVVVLDGNAGITEGMPLKAGG